MADRSVNININYKTNTVEVQKAEQLLKQAQATTNSLHSSADKAGKGISDAFTQANKSIGLMQIELARLKTQIEVTKDPPRLTALIAEYTKLEKQLNATKEAAFGQNKAMKQAAATAEKEAKNAAKAAAKALKEQEKATRDAAKAAEEAARAKSIGAIATQFGQLYTAAKLFLSAGIVKETVSMTLEMAKLAGNVEGVERAFNRAFLNPIALLNDLKTATHGTVSEFELMQRTLQATNLGVAVKQLPVLFEFAAARAQQTGESVDYLVDSIVRGIGRKSILVLDNLGLSATRLKEQFNGASLASQSVADVTRGVAEIARVELEKMGGYAETSATKVDQLTASVQKLKVAFAEKASSGAVVDFFKQGVEGLTIMVQGEKNYQEELLKSAAAEQVKNFTNNKSFKDAEKNNALQRDMILQEIIERQRLLRLRESEIEKNSARLQLSYKENLIQTAANREFEESLINRIQSQKESLRITQLSIPILVDYLKKLQVIGQLDAPEPKGLIESLEEDIEKLGESIRKARTENELFKLNVQLAILQERLKELKDLGKEGNKLAPELPELKLKFKLPTAEEINADTVRLGSEIGESLGDSISKGVQSALSGQSEFLNHLNIAVEGMQQEIAVAGIDIFADQLISFETAELASLQNRLNNLRNFYDEQILLAGDNDRRKQELRLKEEKESAELQKRIAEKERRARRFSIIIDTAAGIAKAFATSSTIYEGIVYAAIVAAQGASQLAIVNRTPARFAKGGLNIQGPGTGTSDSIPAQISKGESVMTAQEWKTSKGVLKAVRAKTLDDKVLNDLKLTRDGVRYMGMDDKNIVKEIKELKNSFPDVEERAGLIYRTRKKTENYKQWVRLSSMSK